jgi:hypothetical protein
VPGLSRHGTASPGLSLTIRFGGRLTGFGPRRRVHSVTCAAAAASDIMSHSANGPAGAAESVLTDVGSPA